MTTTTLTSHVAGLADDSEQVISGVAVGVDDVTRGLSGDRKVWTAEELRAAASTLEGTPVNPLHSGQDVGEVTRAGFEPGRGVIYEARIEDEALARQAADGHLEVSIEARHVDGGTVETDEGEAMLAADIQFTGLSLVQRGAAPSASASPGEAAALSATAIHEALADARLVDVNGTEVDIEPPERVINAIEAGFEAKDEYSDEIGDCGTGVGEAMGQAILDGPTVDLLLDGGDVASNAPATYLDSHSEDAPGTDAPPTEWDEDTWTDGCGPVQDALWGHYLDWFEDTKAEIEAAMEDSEMGYNTDETANMAEVPDEYVFSNPGEAVSKAQEMGLDGPGDEIIHTHGSGEDTVFMPGTSHDDLMEMLREMDELMPDPEFEAGDLVRWSTSASPGTGRVATVASEPGESVSADGADVTREATEDEAAYKLDNWVGPEAGYDEGVVVKSASEILGPWDDAPEEAKMAPAVGATDDPEPGEVAGGEPEARTGARLTETPDTMGDTTTDPETVEELRATLQEKEETVAELRDRVEQLEDERADVAEAYADALAAGDTVLDAEDFAEKFTVAELRERYHDTEDATLADTEPAVQSGGTETDTETATLSDADQEEVAERREAIAALAGSTSDFAETQAEQHAERIAELTDEDVDTILADMN
jgi:hypothetical protein